jgi:hypothetical protein
MSLQSEQVRRTIGRKQCVINGHLQTLHLNRTRENTGRNRSQGRKNRPSPPLKFAGIKTKKSNGINKTVRKVRKLRQVQSQLKPTPILDITPLD